MKRILMILYILMSITFNMFGQLDIKTPKEVYHYETIFEKSIFVLNGTTVEIRLINDSYFLCLSSNNQFEEQMHTINLGNDKSSAIQSLSDLYSLLNKPGEYVVNGIRNKTTIVIPSSKMSAGYVKTEYVAGECYFMQKSIFTEKLLNKMIEAIKK